MSEKIANIEPEVHFKYDRLKKGDEPDAKGRFENTVKRAVKGILELNEKVGVSFMAEIEVRGREGKNKIRGIIVGGDDVGINLRGTSGKNINVPYTKIQHIKTYKKN